MHFAASTSFVWGWVQGTAVLCVIYWGLVCSLSRLCTGHAQESLLLLIPLLARFSRRIPRSLTQAFLGGGQERGTPEGEAGKKKKGGKGSARESETRNESCPICKASPIVSPFRARACAHVFCYYCVRTRAAAAVNTSILQRFPCPLCGVTVDAIKRVQC